MSTKRPVDTSSSDVDRPKSKRVCPDDKDDGGIISVDTSIDSIFGIVCPKDVKYNQKMRFLSSLVMPFISISGICGIVASYFVKRDLNRCMICNKRTPEWGGHCKKCGSSTQRRLHLAVWDSVAMSDDEFKTFKLKYNIPKPRTIEWGSVLWRLKLFMNSLGIGIDGRTDDYVKFMSHDQYSDVVRGFGPSGDVEMMQLQRAPIGSEIYQVFASLLDLLMMPCRDPVSFNGKMLFGCALLQRVVLCSVNQHMTTTQLKDFVQMNMWERMHWMRLFREEIKRQNISLK